MSDVAHSDSMSYGKPPEKSAQLPAKLSKNIALSFARVSVNSIVALILPAYLVHRLPVATYGAWILILQLGAFVSFLDFGVQTGVAKFVAEYDAKGDEVGAGRFATAGLAIMTLTGLLGLLLTIILAWQVPRLFHNMPAFLYKDVRMSVVLVGASLSFGLVCSVFSAVFLGLQRYAVPMGIAIVNRTLFTAAILVAVFLHSSLATMGIATALVNITTGLFQVIAWKQMASHIHISFALLELRVFQKMMRYCSILAIWTMSMVCISGLDVTIVGHYAYSDTAYYSVASMPINFLIMVISSMLGPMMPASSALSTHRSALEMGGILARITRYSTILLLLTGLPLMVYGSPILYLWVGPFYASHSLAYLQILVLANIIRNLCLPYSTMVLATGKLKAATAAPIFEALVNLCSSIYFATRFGAMGVALGTLLGSLAGVSMHFAISMRYTSRTLTISRAHLFRTGVLQPATIVIPSVVLLLCRRSLTTSRAATVVSWGISTLLFAWFGSLNREERNKLMLFTRNQFMLRINQTR